MRQQYWLVQFGEERCENGAWGQCLGGVPNVPEGPRSVGSCDGEDNDAMAGLTKVGPLDGRLSQ